MSSDAYWRVTFDAYCRKTNSYIHIENKITKVEAMCMRHDSDLRYDIMCDMTSAVYDDFDSTRWAFVNFNISRFVDPYEP